MTNLTTYQYRPETFLNEDDTSYYLLGAFMSDGCVHKVRDSSWACSIGSSDKDWLEIIRNYIVPGKPIYDKTPTYYTLEMNCMPIIDWLISKGCTERKSLTLQFPSIPDKYRMDFLRGFMDGDGSMGIYLSPIPGTTRFQTTRMARFCTGSYAFAQSLETAMNDMLLKNRIDTVNKSNRMIGDRLIVAKNMSYQVRPTSGKGTYELCKLLYYSGHKMSMPRKLAIATAIMLEWEGRKTAQLQRATIKRAM